MATTQLATTIERKVKAAVEDVCRIQGLKMNKFIEEALIDKLEEIEDLREVMELKKEPSRPFAAVLKGLKSHGKI